MDGTTYTHTTEYRKKPATALQNEVDLILQNFRHLYDDNIFSIESQIASLFNENHNGIAFEKEEVYLAGTQAKRRSLNHKKVEIIENEGVYIYEAPNHKLKKRKNILNKFGDFCRFVFRELEF